MLSTTHESISFLLTMTGGGDDSTASINSVLCWAFFKVVPCGEQDTEHGCLLPFSYGHLQVSLSWIHLRLLFYFNLKEVLYLSVLSPNQP